MTHTDLALVADDDEDIRDLVAYKLEQLGIQVRTAPDGDEAVAILDRERPALAILDVMMPGRSGLEVLRHIRSTPELDQTKVILLTAKAQEVDVDTGYQSGTDDYLVKPFSPRELAHRVAALLNRAS